MSSIYGGDGTAPSSKNFARVAISSSTNASPIAVTTATNHGYSTGDTVVVEGHTTNTAANGRFVITVTGNTTFTLNGSTGNGVGGATGYVIGYAVYPQTTIPSDGDLRNAASVNVPVQSLLDKLPYLYERVGMYRLYNIYTAQVLDDGFSSYSSTANATVGTATLNGATNASPIVCSTTAAHGFTTGDTVNITGVTGNTATNGTWVITVTDATHFSLGPSSTGNGAYAAGGSCSKFWGSLTSMTAMISQTPTPVCNSGDIFEATFSSTCTTSAAGTEAIGLSFAVGGGLTYQYIPGSGQRFAASYSGPILLSGFVLVGGPNQPLNAGTNNNAFNFGVCDMGNAGSPVTVNLLGHRLLTVKHYRPN